MIIAVDAMGGDKAPSVIVEGCVQAIREKTDIKVIITGPVQVLKAELNKYNYNKDKIIIEDAAEVIGAEELPIMAVAKKKNSSLYVAINLVKDGKAHGVVTAGNTGAFMALAVILLGKIKGVDRPALAPILPGVNKTFMVIDCGANVDCKPGNLVQFAIMGKIYMENVMRIVNPSIGLINIGLEKQKGNELTKEAHRLLSDSSLNFIGNVEPRDISNGDVDVLVCDGFIGNTVLKMYEGVAINLFSVIAKAIKATFISKIGGLILKTVFSNIRKRFDSSEIGGSAFLGVNGICIKAHGNSDSKAVKNAINQAYMLYKGNSIQNICCEIEKNLKNYSSKLKI